MYIYIHSVYIYTIIHVGIVSNVVQYAIQQKHNLEENKFLLLREYTYN